MCDSDTAKTDGSIFMKFSTKINDLTNICEVRFSRILKFRDRDVMAAILIVFLCGTLTVAILLRNIKNTKIKLSFLNYKMYTY